MATSSTHKGWKKGSSSLGALYNGTEVATLSAAGLNIPAAGRLTQLYTVTDIDAQNATLSVAYIVGGIIVHTSATGAGTATSDTAANIIAGSSGVGALANDGDSIMCWYINDGDQTVTLAGGTDVTVGDTGQTVATNESALLLFVRTAATTVTMYHVGA